ncbi:uncharacterized protein LOC111716696 [Eurytemora carolleeae]|uniref:uncharacterized protein LOC111716696 n=1 Tax=Eurytemora carolleeae TaxID=1294199 RepID=UPI000C78D17B|nr:uncharacterized protein LOC111716696 [Eurytemora carolleeae]|eukprot:XP_023347940.1 uncharacterized protein LOC111716696 [Eurytemora affinis]
MSPVFDVKKFLLQVCYLWMKSGDFSKHRKTNCEDTEEVRCLRKVGKNLRVQNGLTESHSNLILNGIRDEELKDIIRNDRSLLEYTDYLARFIVDPHDKGGF